MRLTTALRCCKACIYTNPLQSVEHFVSVAKRRALLLHFKALKVDKEGKWLYFYAPFVKKEQSYGEHLKQTDHLRQKAWSRVLTRWTKKAPSTPRAIFIGLPARESFFSLLIYYYNLAIVRAEL